MSSYQGSFNRAAFQRRIDESIGTANGRPLIKLVWCPTEFRWMPHRLGEDPPGYTFPVFCTAKDTDGEFHAPERWGLLQRIEWPQYGPTWEGVRYKKHDGSIWDLKGPCPSEKYIELRCYCSHDGECCPCIGTWCKCEDVICWGGYAEPDEGLLNWIRKVSWESQHDADVDPHADIRFFEASKAQQQLKSDAVTQQEKSQVEVGAFDREAVDLFLRAPHSISVKKSEIEKALPTGFKRGRTGLYLPN